jgi:plasmid segregation protein ParM
VKILGADIGFGYTKATDGRLFQVFKSVVGEAADIQFAEALLPSAQTQPRHFELAGQAYFVGELAETQSRGRGFTLDPQQFIANYAKQLALAAIAPYADNGEPVRLVTGLPVSFFRRHKDALATLLTARHTLTVVQSNGAREEKQVLIDRVRVIPQPFGSMFNLMLNDIGKPSSQRFVSEKIGIIDVGFRTADYTISDKTRYSERGSGSSDSGISMAFSAIAAILQEKSGVNIELYRLTEAVTKGVIKIRGQRYDLTKVVEQAYQHLAAKIASEVNLLWADDWDLDAIVITGGGGATLAPFLAPLLQGEVLPMPADQDARLNNVSGYWKYGVHLWGNG